MINLSQEHFTELVRCYNDPFYFIENYTWIEIKEESKVVPTVLFDYQRTILDWLINRENILVLKSRRVGGSTAVALYLAWLLNFKKGVNALLLSRNEDAAKKLLAKVKFSMMNIKKHTSNDFALAEDATWMLNPMPVNAQQFLKVGWQNDEGDYVSYGEAYSLTTTKESARGDSATFIFMDELAFLPDQEESMRAARLTVTRGGHWMAVSCQTPDAYVFTENGIQQLGDFIVRDSEVGTFSQINPVQILGNNGLQTCEITYNNGICDTLKITTELNYQIECSLEHPILINREGKIAWCKSKDLIIGDWTPINRTNGCFGTQKIEHPYLLGLILGDGYVYEPHKKITITSIDEEIHQYLKTEYGFVTQKDKIHTCKTLSSIVDYFESIGYKFVTARYKEIPSKVLLSDKDSQRLLLRGLFDTDGCSTSDGRISFVSTSEKMIDQIRMMLLNFGITSAKYHKVSKPTKKVSVYSEQWTLEIGIDAWIFFENIGFNLTRKQNNYNKLKSKSLKDIIPFGATLANKIMSDRSWCTDISLRSRRKQLRHSNRTKNLFKDHKPISYQSAKDVLRYFKEKQYTKEYQELQSLVEKNYRWVRITSIENSSNETWDFSIPQDRSYISNGLISHQTPNGVGDVFHSMCMRAERNENKHYKFLRVHWSEAGMDEEMIERATEGLSDASRNQEMEMEFLSSGDPVFNAMHLAACYRPIEDYPEIELELKEYEKKHRNNPDEFYYYSGVDSAIGKLTTKNSKRDYHSFTALTKSGIQAHSYHSKTDSLTDWAGNIEQLPNNIQVRREGIVSKLHAKYPGLLSIEINGPGQTVWMNHKLPNDSYSNIVIKHTNLKTKDQLIRQLILAIESHSIIITDKFTYQCLIVYQRGSTPGTYSAPLGDYYDDPVISLALAWDILLQNGAMDFSWGSGTDNLVRDRLADEDVLANDLLNLGYGPSILLKQDSGERLSNYGPDNILIPDSDLDISRLNEPEFMKWI